MRSIPESKVLVSILESPIFFDPSGTRGLGSVCDPRESLHVLPPPSQRVWTWETDLAKNLRAKNLPFDTSHLCLRAFWPFR